MSGCTGLTNELTWLTWTFSDSLVRHVAFVVSAKDKFLDFGFHKQNKPQWLFPLNCLLVKVPFFVVWHLCRGDDYSNSTLFACPEGSHPLKCFLPFDQNFGHCPLFFFFFVLFFLFFLVFFVLFYLCTCYSGHVLPGILGLLNFFTDVNQVAHLVLTYVSLCGNMFGRIGLWEGAQMLMSPQPHMTSKASYLALKGCQISFLSTSSKKQFLPGWSMYRKWIPGSKKWGACNRQKSLKDQESHPRTRPKPKHLFHGYKILQHLRHISCRPISTLLGDESRCTSMASGSSFPCLWLPFVLTTGHKWAEQSCEVLSSSKLLFVLYLRKHSQWFIW